jgi:hypothetical protein
MVDVKARRAACGSTYDEGGSMLPCVGDTVTSSVEVAMLGDGSEGGSMMPCVEAAVASSNVKPAMLVVGWWISKVGVDKRAR